MKHYIISLLALLVACTSFASSNLNSSKHPYYGEKFYLDLSSGANNEPLLNSIKNVLRSYHLKVDNSFDQIVNNCSGSKCYNHNPIGYDNARVFLLLGHYLVEMENEQYGFRDVYCDTVKTAKDFRGVNPNPRRLPDSNVINIEHSWPQSRFTGKYSKTAQKSDLHHLFPTDSRLNSTRGNGPFGEVRKDTKFFNCGSARFGIATTSNLQVFEPPANHKGNLARAMFYFSVRYDMQISAAEEAYFRKWAKEDPIDEDEIERNNSIYAAQGNRNPFIDFPDLEDKIQRF